MSEYDSPWKEALDAYFEPFLAFFFPQAHASIDWGRGYEAAGRCGWCGVCTSGG
jgi:hypothetical protein